MKVWLGKCFCLVTGTEVHKRREKLRGERILYIREGIIDQLHAGKSVQGGIECVTVCDLDY